MATNEVAILRDGDFEQYCKEIGKVAVLDTLFKRYRDSEYMTSVWAAILKGVFSDLLSRAEAQCRLYPPRTCSSLRAEQKRQIHSTESISDPDDWLDAFVIALHPVLGRTAVTLKIEDMVGDSLDELRKMIDCAARKYGYRPGEDEINDALDEAAARLLEDPFCALNRLLSKAEAGEWWIANAGVNAMKRQWREKIKTREAEVTLSHDSVSTSQSPVDLAMFPEEICEFKNSLEQKDQELFQCMLEGLDITEVTKRLKLNSKTAYRRIKTLLEKARAYGIKASTSASATTSASEQKPTPRHPTTTRKG